MRGKLRPYFIEQLPASVRTSLLEDTAAFLLHKSSVSGYCGWLMDKCVTSFLHGTW